MRRLLAATILGLLPLLIPAAALAHPLGNFTVNRYSRLELSPEGLRLRYVVDMAEIPTFQALPAIDANGDGVIDEAEAAAFAAGALRRISSNLHLRVAGRSVPLRAASQEMELLPGQAGLRTLRLTAWLEAPAAAALLAQLNEGSVAAMRLEYRDDNDSERIGWREILVQATGLTVQPERGAGAPPRADVSNELLTYPSDMLASPLDVRQVQFDVAAIGAVGRASDKTPPQAAPGSSQIARPFFGSASLTRSADGFTQMLVDAARVPLTPPLLLAALLTSMLLGATHALSPGHGKTIVGAYLAGSRGTARQALFLGCVVTTIHTTGVFTLGLATLYASHFVVPERIYPWISLASGLLVLGMGLALFRSRLRTACIREPAGSGPKPSPLVHDHGGLGRHTHAMPHGQVTWRSLLALGISGGLLPCPSALVVMLGAIALHRVALGLLLIVAFSIGLAGTLSGIGLLMVYSGRAAGRLRLSGRLRLAGRPAGAAMRFIPVMSAMVVALAGLALVAEAAPQLDLGASAGTPAFPIPVPAQPGPLAPGPVGILALLGTALVLGLRHGIDWDHIAAITDITSSTAIPQPRPGLQSLGLASLYALGHALVVVVLGVAALAFRAVLPEWVDPIMERVVGSTLLVLGVWVVYSLLYRWRHGGDFRLQSRWMLIIAGAQLARQRLMAWLHGHSHDERAHRHHVDQYGQYGGKAAFGLGVLHGIGAETGTQVLIIAAVGGAASRGLGLWMLLAFVLGLLVSNTAIALVTSLGFRTSVRARGIYAVAGGTAAAFSLVVGSYLLLGRGDQLPGLQAAAALLAPGL